jgi:superfamily I DNA/RNA helicase
VLVLAGPGAGKTFCLIERIRFLIDGIGVAPERICAFTFTNKAAGEIAERLQRSLGDRAAFVKSGTIHAFCAELLRELGSHAGLEPGFGIADETYQRLVLRRVGANPRWHTNLLNRFSVHRFRQEPLKPNDADFFLRYERHLKERNVLDFDMLLLHTRQLLEREPVASMVRARWDCVLVDEFQDLNAVQYAVIRQLAGGHGHIFAVGDDEQSIYSWAGADPRVFLEYVNDFEITPSRTHHLRENRRCPRGVMAFARKLMETNPRLFDEPRSYDVERESRFAVTALLFPSEQEEIAWVVQDIKRDRERHGLRWGDYALLYRKHEIGDAAESGFLLSGIPCRLAQGRALSEDPACAYVIAALRVIASTDDLHREAFFQVVLPKHLFDGARARAEEHQRPLLEQLERMARELPNDDHDARKIRRGLYAVRNLAALGAKHDTLGALVEELLSQRVGEYRTVLEDHHDQLSDPAANEEVVHLAAVLDEAIAEHRPVWLPRLRGAELALEGVLDGIGVRAEVGDAPSPAAIPLDASDFGTLGPALATFKAAQLVRSRGFTNHFRDFVALDLETTDRDAATAEIVEIAAVRVRDGRIVDEIHSLVRPRVPIAPKARATHRIPDEEIERAPYFEEVWPRVRDFCGTDVIVAHNGYQFDFPILRRMAGCELCTYDTLPLARDLLPGSKKLVDVARVFGIEIGTAHRALDDCRALAGVFLALGDAKVVRARKTALINLLDFLGLALALTDDDGLSAEAELLRRIGAPYALGRYSECLERFRLLRERCGDASLPTVAQAIERLGGEKAMRRIRAQRSADQRYPAAMARLRRIIEQCAAGALVEEINRFLERIALSRVDGVETEADRVNLLTLHSTKGLEFSRVYILGAEDAQLPGGSMHRPCTTLEVEEARRLLYVGMTRAKERLVLTRVEERGGLPAGGHRFLDEMGLAPQRMT